MFVCALSMNEPELIFPHMTTNTALQHLNIFLDKEEDKDDDSFCVKQATFNSENLDTEILSWMYRVAVKIRGDMSDTPGHDSIGGINTENARSCVPESSYLLFRHLCQDGTNDTAEELGGKKMSDARILSIAQDIVYIASNGKKPTPKHIGISLAVHQATRSKELVTLLNMAGHGVSYDTVLRLDSRIAEDAIEAYYRNGNVFIPSNFQYAQFNGYINFANDNIDINEETLSGKGTFHASQTVALRPSNVPEEARPILLKTSQTKSLTVPADMFNLQDAHMDNGKPSPILKTMYHLSHTKLINK